MLPLACGVKIQASGSRRQSESLAPRPGRSGRGCRRGAGGPGPREGPGGSESGPPGAGGASARRDAGLRRVRASSRRRPLPAHGLWQPEFQVQAALFKLGSWRPERGRSIEVTVLSKKRSASRAAFTFTPGCCCALQPKDQAPPNLSLARAGPSRESRAERGRSQLTCSAVSLCVGLEPTEAAVMHRQCCVAGA